MAFDSQIKIYTSLESLCADDNVDLVYIDIATPPYLHYEQSRLALQLGTHAICGGTGTTACRFRAVGEKGVALHNPGQVETSCLANQGIIQRLQFKIRKGGVLCNATFFNK